MEFLLDTNVVSELVRSQPNQSVVNFLGQIGRPTVSAITIAEIEYGIELKDAGRPKDALASWLMELKLSSNILAVTEPIASDAGRIKAKLERKGKKMTLADALIAATALRHSLTLATRNIKDFQACGLAIFNPFAAHR